MTWLHAIKCGITSATPSGSSPCSVPWRRSGRCGCFTGSRKDLGWDSPVDPDTARAVLGPWPRPCSRPSFSFVPALLVAVQLASAALTPRIIAIVFRDPVTKYSLTLLVFTFTFSLSALIRIKATVPLLTAHVAAYGCLVCLGFFFFLIDHLGKVLRPSGALVWLPGWDARSSKAFIRTALRIRRKEPEQEVGGLLNGKPTATIVSPKDGVVLAFDEQGLLSLAQRADCVIELVPQVGDHVAAGDPLFRIFQGAGNTLCQSLVPVGCSRSGTHP